MYIHRQIEGRIIKISKQFPAVALTGSRQSGKSTLLKNVFGKGRRYITFDDPVTRNRAVQDPVLFLESLGDKCIIDEIQYVPQILSYIKIAIDQKRSLNGRFIITGSQQFSLIKNLGDSLAGRIALLELFPFDIEEKKRVPALKNKLKSVADIFSDFCLRGAYPELNVNNKISSNIWYGSYIQTYLERDIRTIFDIGNLRDFQRFIQILASRCSQILNLSNISSDLGVSVNTVKKWLSILEASRIIYLLYPYYKNLGKRIVKAPKVYFLDCGLVCYLTGIMDKDMLLKGPMAGALFENFCVQEIFKSILNYGKSFGLYYLRTQNNLEIDLIIERDMKIFPCEIKLTKTAKINMAEPIERFRGIFSKLRIAEGRILSLSEESFTLTKNVIVDNLLNFINSLR